MKLFELKDVCFRYPKGPWILKNINLEIEEGERVGLVGPSGYGKSTLAQIMAGYLKPVSGSVLWKGEPLPQKGYAPMQLIWQHPERAVNPRWRMKRILSEGWMPEESFLKKIGIEQEWMDRWPIELSGGELQRFCIARALAPQTQFLIAHEMTTMLDVITQAQIWEFLLKETAERNIGLLAVTHNLSLASRICTRVIDLSRIQDGSAS